MEPIPMVGVYKDLKSGLLHRLSLSIEPPADFILVEHVIGNATEGLPRRENPAVESAA